MAQCLVFFLAGFETTSTTITLATYLLALNTDKQEILYQEICDQIKQLQKETKESDLNKLITYDSLSRFEYLSAVVNETLRIYPPNNHLDRTASEDVTLQYGPIKVHIKKGDVIHIPVYSIHHDVRNFPQPHLFKPERFLKQDTFHKYSYLPFGSGPRNCVAKSLALVEVKMAVLHMVRCYRFDVCNETKVNYYLS